jgi:hypothetical protein
VNAKQLRAMLEGIPDDDKVVVATDRDGYNVTGLWFQEGLVVLVAPDLQRKDRERRARAIRDMFTKDVL